MPPTNKQTNKQTEPCCEPCRCGNLNGRIHEASLQTLLTLASTHNLGPSYLGPYALVPLPKKSQVGGEGWQAEWVGRFGGQSARC